MTESTGEKKSTSYLMQTIVMAIQRGNSSCVLETVQDSKKLDGVYYLHITQISTNELIILNSLVIFQLIPDCGRIFLR